MKHLGNCSPREFLAQTLRIRGAAAVWLERTGAAEMMQGLRGLTGEARRDKALEGLGRVLDAALADCPEETARLLGLMCFLEPEEAEAHSMAELLAAAGEIAAEPAVFDFFISLARLDRERTCGGAGR